MDTKFRIIVFYEAQWYDNLLIGIVAKQLWLEHLQLLLDLGDTLAPSEATIILYLGDVRGNLKQTEDADESQRWF